MLPPTLLLPLNPDPNLPILLSPFMFELPNKPNNPRAVIEQHPSIDQRLEVLLSKVVLLESFGFGLEVVVLVGGGGLRVGLLLLLGGQLHCVWL